MGKVKNTDKAKIIAYQNLTDAMVYHIEGDIWKIDTPEQDIYFYSFRDLMTDINENLQIMRELVECGQIEREMWEEAWI